MVHSWVNTISNSIIFSFVGGIPLVALFKKVEVFDCFTKGAQEGFQIAIKIIPYWVGFWVAINMFRAAKGFEMLQQWLSPLLSQVGFPSELLPLAFMRPFSGGASNSILADIAHTHGGSAPISHMAATMMGSTETTFYVVMVYFASVGITRTRHAIPAGLIADTVGITAAIAVTQWLYTPSL